MISIERLLAERILNEAGQTPVANAPQSAAEALEAARLRKDRELAAVRLRAEEENLEAGLQLENDLHPIKEESHHLAGSRLPSAQRRRDELNRLWKAAEDRYANKYRALCQRFDEGRAQAEARYKEARVQIENHFAA